MHVDDGSNVTLVASPALLHNVIQTNKKVGNAGRGTAKTTHTGDVHMFLATHNKKCY